MVEKSQSTIMKARAVILSCGIFLAGIWASFTQPTLEFSATSYTVAESAGSVTLAVQRLGDTNPVVTVDYATADGTATDGLKYLAASNSLTFAAGNTNQTISVPILDDGLVQGNKNFRVILSNPTGGAVLGTGLRTNTTVSITDNDVGVQFQFATYSIAEDAGVVWVAVVRGDNGTNASSVHVSTSDLTGTGGADYVGFTNAFPFAPQERLKLIPIQILNNALKQANRTFRVSLSNPVGLSLGNQKTATVTIMDNDQGLHFDLANYSVAEDAGAARLNVVRDTDDTNSAVSVDFATGDLTAATGLDYIGLTNTLVFAPGERIQHVSIPILNEGVKEPVENLRATLSNPTGGAALGSPITATIKIADNDSGVGFDLNAYSVWENASSLLITVVRGNDAALGPMTVDYNTSNLSAVAGTDYQAVSGSLAFGENETVKTIAVPILRNGSFTNDRSFRVILSNPTDGVLGNASSTATIMNMSEPGMFRAVSPSFDTALMVRQEAGLNVLTWAGGGQLQRADSPSGPWQTLTTATNPYTIQSPIPTSFYRVTSPRPVNVYVPSGYNGQTNMPLVILLHFYTGTGASQENYMQFRSLAEARGFLYCYPDGTIDRAGNHFWNATGGCCDSWSTGVDDAGYLRALIEEIGRQFAVDHKRIYLIGHSNGGFLAYRMACQSADLIAGIASLAGMTFLNPSDCAPSEPVNILHIHGTADEIVPYAGGAFTTVGQVISHTANMPAFPGVLQTLQLWAGYNTASNPTSDTGATLDLDSGVPGLDTVVTRYANAPSGGNVELWTINGGVHIPMLSPQFSSLVVDWLLAHPKP